MNTFEAASTLDAASSASVLMLDWPSVAWAAILAGLTLACLSIKARYPTIAELGIAARVLAHVVIGYFSLGMLAFGASALVRSYFPVPGGAAWEGPVAILGGIAAMTIGGCTLAEHALQVRALRRTPVAQEVTAG